MDISKDEQRVLHALAQGGMIKPLKNAKGRIDALELYNRDGWRMPIIDTFLFQKAEAKEGYRLATR